MLDDGQQVYKELISLICSGLYIASIVRRTRNKKEVGCCVAALRPKPETMACARSGDLAGGGGVAAPSQIPGPTAI